LIRTMSSENPIWGAPRIHSELLKLGIKVSEASVKYMVRSPKPPSQTWRTFLDNHVSQLASIDFFTVHTVWFEVLFVFIVLAHDRRRVLHFNVTAHPTAEWTAQQMLEAFPFDTAPRYLLRDRDRIYGHEFRNQVSVMNIKEVMSAPRSPWQRAYVERVIGSIRRECLDHLIILNEESLRRALRSYFFITIGPGSISRWKEIHQNRDRYNPSAELLPSPKSAGCTIGTNASHNRNSNCWLVKHNGLSAFLRSGIERIHAQLRRFVRLNDNLRRPRSSSRSSTQTWPMRFSGRTILSRTKQPSDRAA
jgi:transposase InsO family protein